MKKPFVLVLALVLCVLPLAAEESTEAEPSTDQRLEGLEQKLEGLSFAVDRLTKKVDDLLWFERVGDVAPGHGLLRPESCLRNLHARRRAGDAGEYDLAHAAGVGRAQD